MVYYFCHCMPLHVCPGDIFILDSRLAFFFFFYFCVCVWGGGVG